MAPWGGGRLPCRLYDKDMPLNSLLHNALSLVETDWMEETTAFCIQINIKTFIKEEKEWLLRIEEALNPQHFNT